MRCWKFSRPCCRRRSFCTSCVKTSQQVSRRPRRNCHNDCHCGNALCDAGETNATCSADCPSGPSAEDCNTPGDEDSNGLADCADPTCFSTPACQSSLTCNNDGTCDANENTASCPDDCAANTCGNHLCDAGESNASCPTDCAVNSVPGGGNNPGGNNQGNGSNQPFASTPKGNAGGGGISCSLQKGETDSSSADWAFLVPMLGLAFIVYPRVKRASKA